MPRSTSDRGFFVQRQSLTVACPRRVNDHRNPESLRRNSFLGMTPLIQSSSFPFLTSTPRCSCLNGVSPFGEPIVDPKGWSGGEHGERGDCWLREICSGRYCRKGLIQLYLSRRQRNGPVMRSANHGASRRKMRFGGCGFGVERVTERPVTMCGPFGMPPRGQSELIGGSSGSPGKLLVVCTLSIPRTPPFLRQAMSTAALMSRRGRCSAVLDFLSGFIHRQPL